MTVSLPFYPGIPPEHLTAVADGLKSLLAEVP